MPVECELEASGAATPVVGHFIFGRQSAALAPVGWRRRGLQLRDVRGPQRFLSRRRVGLGPAVEDGVVAVSRVFVLVGVVASRPVRIIVLFAAADAVGRRSRARRWLINGLLNSCNHPTHAHTQRR